MKTKSVLLIVGGGIAAYKSLELVRLLGRAGVGVRAILTEAGAQFVTPLSLSALSGQAVYQDLFSLTDEAEMGHIQLSRSADLVVVVPATADLMAKAAAGLAPDLATTALLATDKPVLMAPAMNVRMWQHPATRRNLATLTADGVTFVGPDDGAMACGEFGPGRMAEPEAILAVILARLDAAADRPLAGTHILVTAGPTHEPIDPVRYIANRSSGKQGYAIAAALAELGAEVTLVSGPTALAAPTGVRRVEVETARQMLDAARAALPADAAVMVAAVADWRPATAAALKVKKGEAGPRPAAAGGGLRRGDKRRDRPRRGQAGAEGLRLDRRQRRVRGRDGRGRQCRVNRHRRRGGDLALPDQDRGGEAAGPADRRHPRPLAGIALAVRG